MTWVGILVIAIPVFLLISGHQSKRKTIDFYRRYYSREDLEKLRDSGSDIARRALEE